MYATDTEAVSEPYIRLEQTQTLCCSLCICVEQPQRLSWSLTYVWNRHRRLCWRPLYLCNRHRGCVGALYTCVIDTGAVLEAYICVQQTQKLCCSPIYLCERHTQACRRMGGRQAGERAVVPTPPPLVSPPHTLTHTHTRLLSCAAGDEVPRAPPPTQPTQPPPPTQIQLM